jgi:hypothetical protein
MRRKYEVVDVVAAIGLAATLFGGYLLVTAADGFWQRPPAPFAITTPSSDQAAGIRYLQPVLGQAIVDDFLRDRHATATVSSATSELEQAIDNYQAMSTTLLSPLVLAELSALGQAADHETRVQYVMGRSIVNATQRGIRSGVLSVADDSHAFNDGVIMTARDTGRRMDRLFESTRQPLLGQLIVDSVQEEALLDSAAQERIGLAVVRYAVAQASSQESEAAIQSQLGSAVVASIRSNALQERLDRLAMLDRDSTDARTVVAHRRIAPDIEYRYLIAATLSAHSPSCDDGRKKTPCRCGRWTHCYGYTGRPARLGARLYDRLKGGYMCRPAVLRRHSVEPGGDVCLGTTGAS